MQKLQKVFTCVQWFSFAYIPNADPLRSLRCLQLLINATTHWHEKPGLHGSLPPALQICQLEGQAFVLLAHSAASLLFFLFLTAKAVFIIPPAAILQVSSWSVQQLITF